MAEETQELQAGATVQTTVQHDVSVETAEDDWIAAPVYDEMVAEETVVEEWGVADAAPVYQPRGRWDFTEGQQIVIALLLWLNIMVFVLGFMLVSGRLTL